MENIEALALVLVRQSKNSDLKKATSWMVHLFYHGLPTEWQENEKQALFYFSEWASLDQNSSLTAAEVYLSKSFTNQEK